MGEAGEEVSRFLLRLLHHCGWMSPSLQRNLAAFQHYHQTKGYGALCGTCRLVLCHEEVAEEEEELETCGNEDIAPSGRTLTFARKRKGDR